MVFGADFVKMGDDSGGILSFDQVWSYVELLQSDLLEFCVILFHEKHTLYTTCLIKTWKMWLKTSRAGWTCPNTGPMG